MSTDAKPAWGMGWDRQEPAVGRRIYRWTKPGAKFHILWDGSGLWYATPYEESDEPKNYMIYARKKSLPPDIDPRKDEANEGSIRMVYFSKGSIPDMLLFGQDLFEKGFESCKRELATLIKNVDLKTSL